MNDRTICIEVLTPTESTPHFNVTSYELPSSCERIVVCYLIGQELPDVRGFTKDDAQEFKGAVRDTFKAAIVA